MCMMEASLMICGGEIVVLCDAWFKQTTGTRKSTCGICQVRVTK